MSKLEEFGAWIARVSTWAMNTLPGRVITRFSQRRAGTLAGGLAFGLIFAFFAAIWTVFSVIGLVFTNNSDLMHWLLNTLEQFVPGLSISEETLTSFSPALTWTGIVTFVLLLWKVIAWMGSWRSSARAMLDVEEDNTDVNPNPVLTILGDVVAVIAVIVLFLASSVAGVVSGGIARRIMALLNKAGVPMVGSGLIDFFGFLVGYVLNVALLIVLYRFVAKIKHHRTLIIVSSLVCGLVISLMQLLGSRLLGGASSNPLLAPFAAFIGMLIWFNLIAQVLMVFAALIGELISPTPPKTVDGAAAGDASGQAKGEAKATTKHTDAATAQATAPASKSLKASQSISKHAA